MTVKYPQIHVKLVGEDGNEYNILARVRYALKQANIPQSEIDAFLKTATNSDYNNMLRVVTETVEVDSDLLPPSLLLRNLRVPKLPK